MEMFADELAYMLKKCELLIQQQIGFRVKNSEIERNSEIVASTERENYDFFGVNYRGNKDLRRILPVSVRNNKYVQTYTPIRLCIAQVV
jgi:NADH:ubiquinone oxidoreductase subunit C